MYLVMVGGPWGGSCCHGPPVIRNTNTTPTFQLSSCTQSISIEYPLSTTTTQFIVNLVVSIPSTKIGCLEIIVVVVEGTKILLHDP